MLNNYDPIISYPSDASAAIAVSVNSGGWDRRRTEVADEGRRTVPMGLRKPR